MKGLVGIVFASGAMAGLPFANPLPPVRSGRAGGEGEGRPRADGHKAEHAVDLASGAAASVALQPAGRGDTTYVAEILEETQRTLKSACLIYGSRRTSAVHSLVIGAFSLVACRADDTGYRVAVDRIRIAQEQLRIGSIDGATALTRPADAVIVEDQRVFFLFPREAAIRVFGPQGNSLALHGGRGAGPGEFTSPDALHLLGDSVVVIDQPRIALIPIDGGEPRSFMPIVPQPPSVRELPEWPVALLAKQSVLLRPHITRTGLRPNLLDSVKLSVLGKRSMNSSWLASLRYENHTMMIRDPDATGPRAYFTGYPFANDDLWAVQANGTAVIVLNRAIWAREGAVRLLMLAPSGDTLVSRRVGVSAGRRIVEEEVDSVVDEYVGRILESRGTRPPNPIVGERWVRDALGDVPEFHAPVDDLTAASDGHIWLKREDGRAPPGRQAWLRLDRRGNPLEWVRLPADVRVLDARADVVWGWTSDELDIPYLTKYQLVEASELQSPGPGAG